MSLNEALAILRKIAAPVIRTNDAAAIWSTSRATASTMLARLAKVGHIKRLTRGIWLLDTSAHAWLLHPYLTEPAPSYLSLHTALFHHGMIEQIPSTVHVVSTIKSRTVNAGIAVYSIHQIAPAFFVGFEPLDSSIAQIAVPEKSLVDFLYFRPAKTRFSRALPELELPKGFSKRLAREFVALIASNPRRSMVEERLTTIFKTA